MRRSALTLSLTLAACAVFACDEGGDAAPPAEAPAAPPGASAAAMAAAETPAAETPEPEREPAPPALPAPEAFDRCELAGEARGVGTTSTRVRGLALAPAGEGALLGFPLDDTHVRVQPLSRDGAAAGEPVDVEIPGAKDLDAMMPLGEHVLLTTQAPCPSGVRGGKCLHLVALDTTGAAAGPVLTDATHEWIRHRDVERVDDSLWMLRGFQYRPPELVRYRVGDGGEIVRDVAMDLADLMGEDGEPLASLALAATDPPAVVATGNRALWKSSEATRRLRGLPSDARILAAMQDGEGLHVLFEGADGGPVRYARFGEDGQRQGDAQPASGATLPEGVGTPGPTHEYHDGGLRWVLRDAARGERQALEVAPLPDRGMHASTAFAGGGLVAWSDPARDGTTIHVRAVRCTATE